MHRQPARCQRGFEATRGCLAVRHATRCVAMRPQVMAAHFRLSRPNPGKFDAELPPGFALKLPATIETTMGTHPYRLKPGFPVRDLSPGSRGVQIAPIGAEMFAMERRNHYDAGAYANVCMLFSVDTCDLADKLRKSKTVVKSRGSTFFSTSQRRRWCGRPGTGNSSAFPPVWFAPSEAPGSHGTLGASPISPADQANFRFSRRTCRPERRPAAGVFRHRPGCACLAALGFRGRIGVFHSGRPGAAHPLQNHRGTDQEDCRSTQSLAGRRRNEEMAQ